jgi:hypothetical protein
MAHPDYRIPVASVKDLDDEDLCWAMVDPVWPTDETLDELEHIGEATLGQRAIYTTMLYAREVDNGGLRQFLHNSSSMYYRQVLEGLDLLGAVELRQALATVLTFFPDGQLSPHQVERKHVLDAMSAEQRQVMRAHETATYAGGGFEGNLVPLWTRYIREHPSDFFLD